MNSLFKLKNLIRCCPNCICATKIEKSIAQIPINNIEKKKVTHMLDFAKYFR